MNEIGGVAVNARFRARPITGVERYAHGVLDRLIDLTEVAPVEPSAAMTGWRGHLWEQTALPRRTRGRLLWNPANSGPIAGVRHVTTVHDPSAIEHPEWFSRPFAAWYGRALPRLLSSADAVTTTSQWSAQRLAYYCRQPPVVIPGGVDAAFCAESAETDEVGLAALGISRPFVLTVGSLQPRKNLSAVLGAWPRVRHRLPDHRLVIVGAGGRSFAAEPTIGQVAADRSIALVGRVTDAQLAALYRRADAFVYVPLYEGFGLPPLEAAASGTPTVISDIGPLVENRTPLATVVAPDDHAAIGEAIVSQVERPPAPDRRNTTAREVQARYTWDAAAVRLASLLEQLR